jgi:hypothetical protein
MLATAKTNCHPASGAHVSRPLTNANLVALEHQTSPNRQTEPKFCSNTNEESFKNMKQITKSLGLELPDWVIEDMAQGNRSGVGLEAFFAGLRREERRL